MQQHQTNKMHTAREYGYHLTENLHVAETSNDHWEGDYDPHTPLLPKAYGVTFVRPHNPELCQLHYISELGYWLCTTCRGYHQHGDHPLEQRIHHHHHHAHKPMHRPASVPTTESKSSTSPSDSAEAKANEKPQVDAPKKSVSVFNPKVLALLGIMGVAMLKMYKKESKLRRAIYGIIAVIVASCLLKLERASPMFGRLSRSLDTANFFDYFKKFIIDTTLEGAMDHVGDM
ncbi:hypothetical protein EV182_007581, partial [Spiromyces aspiralis]